jgi:RNase P/RNase MRP subunit p29
MRSERKTSTRQSIWRLLLIVSLLISSSACGYRVAGRGVRLPKELKTIAVLPFENRTTRHRIERRLTDAVIRELLARTKYRIVHSESDADAVLKGSVSQIESSTVLFDANTGRAITMLVTVRMQVRLTDRVSGQVLYENKEFLFREEYEISTDVASFFEEQEPALGRLAREFAAALVAAILENF